MKKNLLVFLITFLSCAQAFATNIDDLTWIYHINLPFTTTDEVTNKPKGTAIELVELITKDLSPSKKAPSFIEAAFGRVMYELKTEKNIAALPIIKSSERITEFKWAGPIGTFSPVIWTKKSNKIDKNNIRKYLQTNPIGIKENSLVPKIIMEQGFDGSNLAQNTTDEDNFKKLASDRLMFVACDKTAGMLILKQQNLNIDDYEIIYNLPTFDFFIGFSLDVSDDLVGLVQKSIDNINAKGIN